MDQITDSEMLQLALTETAKVVPYVISSRKAVKLYLKAYCFRISLRYQHN